MGAYREGDKMEAAEVTQQTVRECESLAARKRAKKQNKKNKKNNLYMFSQISNTAGRHAGM